MATPSATERDTAWRAARKRSTARCLVLHPDGSIDVRTVPRDQHRHPSLRLRADGSVRVQRGSHPGGGAARRRAA